MTTDEMRIAVAESLGFTECEANQGYGLIGWTHKTGFTAAGVSKVYDGKKGYRCLIPNYPADLNAMHEAALTLGWIHGGTYAMELRKIVVRDQTQEMVNADTGMLSDLYFYEATAAQRCEVYLIVKGLLR